jgi:hypothetical protein
VQTAGRQRQEPSKERSRIGATTCRQILHQLIVTDLWRETLVAGGRSTRASLRRRSSQSSPTKYDLVRLPNKRPVLEKLLLPNNELPPARRVDEPVPKNCGGNGQRIGLKKPAPRTCLPEVVRSPRTAIVLLRLDKSNHSIGWKSLTRRLSVSRITTSFENASILPSHLVVV